MPRPWGAPFASFTPSLVESPLSRALRLRGDSVGLRWIRHSVTPYDIGICTVLGVKRCRRIGVRGLERGINARYGAFPPLLTRLSVLLLWSYLASLLSSGIYKGFGLNVC